jgi:hypothetical protein
MEREEDKKWVGRRAKDERMTGRQGMSKSKSRQGVFFRRKRHEQVRLMSIMLDTASLVGARVQLRLQAAGCSSSRKYMHNMA